MDYSINPSTDQKYIVLKCSGKINHKNNLNSIVESHALGKKLNIKHYLLDVTEARNTGSILDDYHFAYNNVRATRGIDQSAIFAMVTSPNDHSHDFVETVSRNSGLNMTLFRDMNAAIHHLLTR